eukprot:6192077-Pleurochrysis_carterae.AAC.3
MAAAAQRAAALRDCARPSDTQPPRAPSAAAALPHPQHVRLGGAQLKSPRRMCGAARVRRRAARRAAVRLGACAERASATWTRRRRRASHGRAACAAPTAALAKPTPAWLATLASVCTLDDKGPWVRVRFTEGRG